MPCSFCSHKKYRENFEMGKNLNCLVKYAVSLFIIFAKTNEINMTACSVSLPTLQKVSKCPTTEKELLAAKESKDCQSLAEVQKCVRPQNFTYHCVINFSANEIYEVCAPAIYSQGRCLEFNIYGRVIQEIQNASCVKDGCPKRFSSADTLQYADCSTSIKKKSSNTCTCSNWKEEFIAFAVFSGVLLLLLLVVLPSLLCLQKKFPRCFRGNL
ncbi:uncharacterized protein LOC134262398 [Saccostrea cucullata]|uniref:uncharacterized protein LOC134262398 n=1 Tax=Saccostrea cuccullata TaxID=36930 RepID=UPI002ED135A4